MSEDRSINGQKSWFGKITQAFAHEPKNRDELLDVLRGAHQNKLLDNEALAIVEGAIQVADLQVRDIMVPRSQVMSIRADQTPKEFLPAIISAAHSRYPVIGESLDEVIGVLLAKDLLPLILQDDQHSFDIKDLLRPATFVPESKRLNVLLREFRANHSHMAIVIDEYGGVAGLVTIEDVLEQIVGDIEDEHDIEEDSYIRPLPSGDFLVKALTPIDSFNEFFHSAFPDDEFDTVAGLVMSTFGHLPKRNEITEIDGFRFRVLNADSRRVHMLRLTRIRGENGWRLEAGQCADLRLTPDKLFRSAFQPLALLSAFFILERSADALDKSSRLAGQSACHGWRRTDHFVAGAFRYLAAGVALHRSALFGVAHAGAETRRAARLVLRLRPVQLRRQLGLRQHP